MVSSTETQELSQDEERLGEFLSALADKSFHDAEELDAEIDDLPNPLKKRVRSFGKRLERLTGLEERDRQKLLDEYKRAVDGAYVESMTGLPNRRFAHEHLSSLYDDIVRAARKGKTTEALTTARSRAFISFDLDGLKVVNDLATPEKGDKYIKLFGEVVLGAAQTLELEKKGMRVEAARDGGDEFSLIIDWPGHEIDLKEIDAIVRFVQETFAERNVGDIINLRDATAGLEKKGLTFEDGFTFRPSVSGGGTSFYDALRIHIGAKTAEGDYRATLASLAGFTRDLGGVMAKKVKARMREAMHAGTPSEKFLAQLFDQFRPIAGEERTRIEELERMIRERDAVIERLEAVIAAFEQKYAALAVENTTLKAREEDWREELARAQAENAELRLALQAKGERYAKKRSIA